MRWRSGGGGFVGECPDLESIASYIDRWLEGDATLQIEEHLARCSDCYHVFAESCATMIDLRGWSGRRDGLVKRRRVEPIAARWPTLSSPRSRRTAS
jgi:hypothetical protein